MRVVIIFSFFSITILGQSDKILSHQGAVKIVNLEILNSPFRECNLSVSPNGQELFFMSTRPSKINKIGGDGDLYKSVLNADSSWSKPIFLKELNTTSGEDEPSLSMDANSFFYQSWKNTWMNENGPYFQAKVENGSFKNAVGLGGGIAQFFRDMYSIHSGYGTDGMAISSDGKLFIVACGPDYYGAMDLYYSVKVNGVWSYPQVMGVSTDDDERAVFIAADNKTIYFSSDGHGGFGGLDIFKTVISNGKLGEIVNIGSPFNTVSDDRGFVITENGNAAFLIRDLDIYYADLTELSDEIKPILSSRVYDDPIEKSKIEIKEFTDSSKIMENIMVNFDFDTYYLNSKSLAILESIKTYLHNSQKIKLIGHTDEIGDDAYNDKLSFKRVESVKSWFLANGFNNIITDAKGEKFPIVQNGNDALNWKNRRVEIIFD